MATNVHFGGVDEAENESSSSSAQEGGTGSSDETPRGAIDISQLQSRDQATLLGAIDRLRREHIDADISIPQMVVCGDQSSGKSSVLEAIAGVPFPIGASTTTRFATEVILRQSNREDISVKVIASPDRTAEQKRNIENFQPSFTVSGPQDFGRLIEEAGRHLRSVEPENKFWKDWLRAEVSGPRQPHLTLVDLPGIIQNESPPNAAPGDKQKIKELVQEYLRNPRTIVLAVVDAQNNLENQEIVGLARETAIDRTLGIITKPDRLDGGSDLQKDAIRIARNESLRLSLGWHVLRNLPHEQEDRSPATRDGIERNFFETSEWAQLSNRDVGIDNLRKKLSEHLFKRIATDLPTLIDEMTQKLEQCKTTLERLGPARATVEDQREYLLKLLGKLQRLIENALEGDYDKEESKAFFDGSREKNIRYGIRADTEAFADRMRRSGKLYHIYHDNMVQSFRQRNADLDEFDLPEDVGFYAPVIARQCRGQDGRIHCVNVDFERYCESLLSYIRETRGTALPGLRLAKVVQPVFRQLSVPWSHIAVEFVHQSSNAALGFLRLAIKHIAGDYTGEALLRTYVYGGPNSFETKRMLLEQKVDELLWPYRECHPITYNPEFPNSDSSEDDGDVDEEPQSDREYQTRNDKAYTTWREAAQDLYPDSIEAAEALQYTESYYNIALNTFIENVATLGIERCLLHNLSNIIPSGEATRLEDEKVQEIAAEPPQILQDRAKAEAQSAALEEVIRVCRPYAVPEPAIIAQHRTARNQVEVPETSEPTVNVPTNQHLNVAGSTSRSPSASTTTCNPQTTARRQTSGKSPFDNNAHFSFEPPGNNIHGNATAGSLFVSTSNAQRPVSSFSQSTDVSSSSKPAGSGSLFANLGSQTNTTSTGSGLFGNGSGLTSARTGTNDNSEKFGNNPQSSGFAAVGGKNSFGGTSPFGLSATPTASTGSLFGKSQTDQTDRPRSTGPSVFGSGGFKSPNANGEGPASGTPPR